VKKNFSKSKSTFNFFLSNKNIILYQVSFTFSTPGKMSTPKYLFLYPKGGLTDTLFVINSCFQYAKKYNRIVVIVRADKWIEDGISYYIQFDDPCIFKGSIQDIDIKNCTYFPADIVSPFDIDSVWCNETDGYKMMNKSTGEYSLCSINFDTVYDEDIIIYSTCYGGVPRDLIPVMKFSPFLIEEYQRRMHLLGHDYLSLHIRNTDRVSNIESFLEEHGHIINHSSIIFLATDDYKTIQYMFEKYGSGKIKHFSKITDNRGNNMHYYYNREELSNREMVSDAIIDLLMLASAKAYIFSNSESSYSLLAQHLYKNPSLLQNLISLEKT